MLNVPSTSVLNNKPSQPDDEAADMPARLVGDTKFTMMKFPDESNAALRTAGGAQKLKLLDTSES